MFTINLNDFNLLLSSSFLLLETPPNPTVITTAPTLQVPSLVSYQIPITTVASLLCNALNNITYLHNNSLPRINLYMHIQHQMTQFIQ